VHIRPVELRHIQDLKSENGSDIYLCGGGIFAGWLLKNQLIDKLRIKFNPILLGGGVRLFDHAETQAKLSFKEVESYGDGLQILNYDI
jgi:dihydrofolate reductase